MYRRKHVRGGLAVGALSLLTLAGALSTPQVARAQGAAQAVKVGIVDESQVGDQYTKLKDALQKYETRATTLQPQLEARAFMPADEGKQFDTLIMQDTMNADETTKLATLVAAGAARRVQYSKLVGQAQRSDADNTSLKNLQDIMQNAQVGSQRIEDQLLAKIKDQQKKEVDALVGKADDAIKAVAVSKGLTVVLRKDAVIWNSDSVDITKDVLDKLNAK